MLPGEGAVLSHQALAEDSLSACSCSTHLAHLKPDIIDRLGCGDVEIDNNRSFLYKMGCPECSTEKDCMDLAARVMEDKLMCREYNGFSLDISEILRRMMVPRQIMRFLRIMG